MTYKGYLVEEIDGSFVGNIKDIDIPKISDENVLIIDVLLVQIISWANNGNVMKNKIKNLIVQR